MWALTQGVALPEVLNYNKDYFDIRFSDSHQSKAIEQMKLAGSKLFPIKA